MWNNVYDVDKRHSATVVRRKNQDYKYKKKTIFIRNRRRSELNDLN